jgi:lipid-binding SYLF domain-containing protein
MKFAAIMLAAAGLAVAGSAAAASASAIKTDADFLRASRCKGLAAGMGVDTTSIDNVLQSEGRFRQPTILSMATEEVRKAERQARDLNRKEKVSAELAGPCTAYLGAANDVASR